MIHTFYGDVLCTFETERVFSCINIWQGSLIYVDYQRWVISCLETNADMLLWKVNFFSTKNWAEGSTFPIAIALSKFLQHSDSPFISEH